MIDLVPINPETIALALSALREGRSTGDPRLDRMRDSLGRCWQRAQAWVRREAPQLPESMVDRFAEEHFTVVTQDPTTVALLVMADTVRWSEDAR